MISIPITQKNNSYQRTRRLFGTQYLNIITIMTANSESLILIYLSYLNNSLEQKHLRPIKKLGLQLNLRISTIVTQISYTIQLKPKLIDTKNTILINLPITTIIFMKQRKQSLSSKLILKERTKKQISLKSLTFPTSQLILTSSTYPKSLNTYLLH